MLLRLPVLLIWLRLPLGLLVLLLGQGPATPFARGLGAALLGLGLLTDIFDGILARRLGVATAALRRLDSTIDTLFWLGVAGGVLGFYPEFLASHLPWIAGVLGLEVLTYLVSYGRFRREIALHTLGAKLWALLLAACLTRLLLTGEAGSWFGWCVGVGVVSRLEILAIVGVLPAWAADVPTLYQALQLRRGRRGWRHPLFNS